MVKEKAGKSTRASSSKMRLVSCGVLVNEKKRYWLSLKRISMGSENKTTLIESQKLPWNSTIDRIFARPSESQQVEAKFDLADKLEELKCHGR
jgi:hypothetical protein